MRRLLLVTLLASLSGTPSANALGDPPPEHLIIGYPFEGEIDANAQKCIADVTAETTNWRKEEIGAAARKQCDARKRHVASYKALQSNYHLLMGLLNLRSGHTMADQAAASMKALVNDCISHKEGVSTGGHNVMVNVIENDIVAKCLDLGANVMREEIREIQADECVPGLKGSC